MTDRVTDNPERPWPNPLLEVGAIIGHTTSTTCRLWLRTHVAGNFALLVFCPAAGTDPIKTLLKQVPLPPLSTLLTELGNLCQEPVQMEAFTTPLPEDDSADTTRVVDLNGLTAFTDYHYALVRLDDPSRSVLGHRRPHSFRTLTDQQNQPFSFGFFSCHMPYKTTLFKGRTKAVNEEMWDYMNGTLSRHKNMGTEKNLGFIIAGGDQVYADGVDTLNIWKLLNKVMRRDAPGEDGLHPGHDTMVSWYRDIYRGYWGFAGLREVYSSFPTYMIWDDHEIGDGWGSFNLDAANPGEDELNEVLPDWQSKLPSHADGIILMHRMFNAAKQVYEEYQHSHNPDKTDPLPGDADTTDRYDYDFTFPNGAVYVLDGRSQRDYSGTDATILGQPQIDRFKAWLDGLDKIETPFAFVVSAVPLMHLSKHVVDLSESWIADNQNLTDDLRDGWEHRSHRNENKQLLDALFAAADSGLKVSVLSGDVHVAAAFRMQNADTGATIYQLTSSAITFNLPLLSGFALGVGVPDDGKTEDGHTFKRLARYTDSNYSLIRINPKTGILDFQLYSEQDIINPKTNVTMPMTHSIAKLELGFGRNQN